MTHISRKVFLSPFKMRRSCILEVSRKYKEEEHELMLDAAQHLCNLEA